jgi:hypothetical protein
VSSDNSEMRPPQPTEFKRKFQLYPYQYILMPLIFLIPILALLGVFGETTTTQDQANRDLAMRITYNSRSRHRLSTVIKVYITNQTDAPLSNLNARFDRGYMDGFEWVSFLPTVTEVTDDAYIITLETIPAGETHAITVDLKAKHIGLFAGLVTVEGDGIEPVSIRLESFTFP